MNWLEDRIKKVQNFLKPQAPQQIKGIPLGKYSELDRSPFQLESLSRAQSLFKSSDQFVESINAGLDFVLDPEHIKGSYQMQESGQWEFMAMHGSVLMQGHYTSESILVEAILLRGGTFKPSMLRQLLESSLDYDFINFGINDSDELVIRFYLNALEANPDIFIQAMKEMSLAADFFDSKFATDFADMQWVSLDHVLFDPPHIAQMKYELYRSELSEIKDYSSKINSDQDLNIIHAAYRMLGYLYKSDFLVSPRNYLFGLYIDLLNQYWHILNQEPNNFLPAVSFLKESLEDQIELSEEDFRNEAVNLPYLFSTRDQFDVEAIQSAVRTHLPNVQKYSDEGDKTSQYWGLHTLLGMISFHQDIDHEWNEWIYYLYCLTDGHYLNSLGYVADFMSTDPSKVDTEEIKNRLQSLIEAHSQHPRPLPPLPENLDVEDPLDMLMQILGVFG